MALILFDYIFGVRTTPDGPPLTLFYMGSGKYLNTWGGNKVPPYIKVLKMLETWLQGMSDTLNESLEHVKVIFRQKRWDLEQKKFDFFDFSILA